MVPELQAAVMATWSYWSALVQWVFLKKGYDEVSAFKGDKHAHVQVYSLALVFSLWAQPHYRCRSFQQDMLDNLRNVAIPGTGVPLSIFCHSWWLCLLFVAFTVPVVCFLGAVNKCRKAEGAEGGVAALLTHYREHLLHPMDWFSFWRLNCRLVSQHSLQLRPKGYTLEDKWTFLRRGAAIGVPVSPFMSTPVDLVVKNKNIEGGMGIYFYKNAVHGGDWILQQRLQNAKWLDAMLPSPAPLSTMRVITSSTWTLAKHGHTVQTSHYGPGAGEDAFPDELAGKRKHGKGGGDDLKMARKYITPLSAVLRLGRANASTDHSSVLFDVDIANGKVKQGTSNSQWYHLGPTAVTGCPWLPQGDGFTCHPDTPDKSAVSGQAIPDMQAALDVVVHSHHSMLADVPLVGWDVAFCADGIYLLEVNLSCNFFKGTFDVPAYLSFVDDHFRDLQTRADKDKKVTAAAEKKTD